ncbi:hypothetical protein SAMN05880590_10174 [Rhizobium sp. RU35A]|uniref:hypothetical protein n=1 Tax=Rhizobium sp. RU35A TaxID=1907414 RepID=UPI0009573E21|nr:hypothetical protein [Rhizobium sp. RU35A]SIP89821.1 hypothetical protein SAMN05880590_10174 [Rhizobium sp. RU35A]
MIEIDDKELEALQRAFRKLPGEIKTKVMARAMRKLRNQVRTRIVGEASKHTNMPRPMINALTTAYFNAGGNTQAVVVESGWIHLYKYGAVMNAKGTYVNARGQYNHAFVTGFKSGHYGVMRRVLDTQMPSAPASKRRPGEKVKRQQIRELFGPNPAHAITNDPDRYMEQMADIVREYLMPNFARELDRALTFR